MGYLQYLENKEQKRKLTKSIIVKSMYVLIPLFLMGTTFVNERIITECEVIHEERMVYRDSIIHLEGKIVRLENSGAVDQEKCYEDIANLKRQLAEKDREITHLRNDKAKLLAEGQINRDTISSLRNRNVSLHQMIADLENKNAKFLSTINGLDTSIADLQRTINSLKREVAGLKQEIGTWRNKYTTCTVHEKQLEDEITGLKNRIRGLEIKLDSYAADKKAYRKEIDTLNARIKQLQASINNPSVALILGQSSPPGTKPDRICSYKIYAIRVNGKNVKYIRAENCID